MIRNETEARAYVAGLVNDPVIMDQLDLFTARLGEENGRQNLVAAASLPHVWCRHIADSAQLLAHVPRETAGPWLDLGSGAGFPGLIIAILQSGQEITLVESRRKRIDWLERIVGELGLAACRIEGRRLEQVETAPVAVISARAFAPLAATYRLSTRFSTERTMYLLPKGRSAAQELHDMPDWIRQTFHVEQSLTDPEAGIVVGRLSREAQAMIGRGKL